MRRNKKLGRRGERKKNFAPHRLASHYHHYRCYKIRRAEKKQEAFCYRRSIHSHQFLFALFLGLQKLWLHFLIFVLCSHIALEFSPTKITSNFMHKNGRENIPFLVNVHIQFLTDITQYIH